MTIQFSLKRSLLPAVAFLLAAGALHAQTPQTPPTAPITFTRDEIRIGSRPYAPPSETNLRVRTDLVEVRVVVRDAKGKPVAGLRQEDFTVLDNGKPQAISVFTVETAAPPERASEAPATPNPSKAARPRPSGSPRFVALFFDDLNMGTGDIIYARKAAEQFVTNDLGNADQVGIFTSSGTVTLDFTVDPQRALESLAELRSQSPVDAGTVSCPRMLLYQAHLINEREDRQAIELGVEQGIIDRCIRGPQDPPPQDSPSVRVAMVKGQARQVVASAEGSSRNTIAALGRVVQYLGERPGRRMILLASSGFLARSFSREQDQLIAAAVRAEVVINSLDAKGLDATAPGGYLSGGRPSGLVRGDLIAYADSLYSEQRRVLVDPLASLAEGTGGKFFHDNNDLAGGFRELAAIPEVSYLIGFAPPNLAPDGTFHDLKVKLTAPGSFKIDARRGYYAPTKEDLQPRPPGKLDTAVMGSEEMAQLNIQVNTEHGKLETGETALHVAIQVDPRSLPFQKRAERNTETVRFIAALFDAQGRFVGGMEGIVNLSLKDRSLPLVIAEGLETRVSLKVPPGAYRLRVVVRELVKGRMTALSRPVEIPAPATPE